VISVTGNGMAIDVVFFDLRDSLGEVDRPGHLVPYRPSTQKLLSAMKDMVGLRIGIITNLPSEVSAADGHKMIEEAVLSEEVSEDGDPYPVKLIDFLDPDGVVINHEAGASKPDPAIYRYAARKVGVPIERCLFSGENLIEVLGAQAAGMQTQLKPCPPGREFLPAVITKLGETETDSGRAFEAFFEHEHLLGQRIFACGAKIADVLKGLKPGDPIPDGVRTAMAMLVYLTQNFADQAHLKAEEAVIPLAVARGMDPKLGQWVFDQHDQARAYWAAMEVAWRRIEAGDPDDAAYAVGDFWRTTEAFVVLFEHHAVRENDELYPAIGRHLSDSDDTLVMNLVTHIGPPDITPYAAIVAAMEHAVGLPSPDG
jgi:hemerythrin-like domain-containing protein